MLLNLQFHIISDWCSENNYQFIYRLSLLYSRLQKFIKHISIRRLKSDKHEGKLLVELPPRTVVIQEVELSKEERDLYDSMQKDGQLIIKR